MCRIEQVEFNMFREQQCIDIIQGKFLKSEVLALMTDRQTVRPRRENSLEEQDPEEVISITLSPQVITELFLVMFFPSITFYSLSDKAESPYPHAVHNADESNERE